MQSAACLVGNSSASIREGAFIGTPAVNVGSRQDGRERGPNVVDVGTIARRSPRPFGVSSRTGPYQPAHLYGDGRAGVRIADVLARAPLHVQKRIQVLNVLGVIPARGGSKGHSAQESRAARGPAAHRVHDRGGACEPPSDARRWSAQTTRRSPRRRGGWRRRAVSASVGSWRSTRRRWWTC